MPLNLILQYLIQLTATTLFGALIWLAFLPWRRARLSASSRHAGPWRDGILLLFFMFLSGLLALTLTPPDFWMDLLLLHRRPTLPAPFQGGINLIPLRESWRLYRYYVRIGFWDGLLLNFLGNIVMFLPIGFLPLCLWTSPAGGKARYTPLGSRFLLSSSSFLFLGAPMWTT